MQALELGAVDTIAKPRLGSKQFLEESRVQLCEAVKAAAAARLRTLRPSQLVEPKLTADAILPRAASAMLETTEKVVVIGASTGGTEALRSLLEALPPDAPGYRNCAAHAGGIHPCLRKSPGQPVPDFGERGRT